MIKWHFKSGVSQIFYADIQPRQYFVEDCDASVYVAIKLEGKGLRARDVETGEELFFWGRGPGAAYNPILFLVELDEQP